MDVRGVSRRRSCLSHGRHTAKSPDPPPPLKGPNPSGCRARGNPVLFFPAPRAVLGRRSRWPIRRRFRGSAGGRAHQQGDISQKHENKAKLGRRTPPADERLAPQQNPVRYHRHSTHLDHLLDSTYGERQERSTRRRRAPRRQVGTVRRRVVLETPLFSSLMC